MGTNSTFLVITGDERTFHFTSGMIDQSESLPTIVQATQSLKLSGSTARCMELVVQWLGYHIRDTPEEKKSRATNFREIPIWDVRFLAQRDAATLNGINKIAYDLQIGRLKSYYDMLVKELS